MVLGVIVGVIIGLLLAVLWLGVAVYIELTRKPTKTAIETLKRAITPKAEIIKRPSPQEKANDERIKRAKEQGVDGLMLEDIEL